jgi:hypothetical protein
MRKVWNLIITVRPKLLLYIAFVSIVVVLLVEFFLIDIKTEYALLYKPTPVLLKICYSLISAFIFYFFAVHFPRERRRAKVYRYISNRVFIINEEIHLILYTILAISKKEINQTELNKVDFINACKQINPKISFYELYGLSFSDWYEYLTKKKNVIEKLLDGLIQLNDLIDSDLQEQLTLIHDILTRDFRFPMGKPNNDNLVHIGGSIIELLEESRRMKEVFDSKYSKFYSEIYHESSAKKNLERKSLSKDQEIK